MRETVCVCVCVCVCETEMKMYPVRELCLKFVIC